MCQQGEDESSYLVYSRRLELRAKYNLHLSGEEPLTDEQLSEMAAEMMILLGD